MTELENFDAAMKKILSVSKEELNRRIADDKQKKPKRETSSTKGESQK